jgi:hypothetical protein
MVLDDHEVTTIALPQGHLVKHVFLLLKENLGGGLTFAGVRV